MLPDENNLKIEFFCHFVTIWKISTNDLKTDQNSFYHLKKVPKWTYKTTKKESKKANRQNPKIPFLKQKRPLTFWEKCRQNFLKTTTLVVSDHFWQHCFVIITTFKKGNAVQKEEETTTLHNWIFFVLHNTHLLLMFFFRQCDGSTFSCHCHELGHHWWKFHGKIFLNPIFPACLRADILETGICT